MNRFYILILIRRFYLNLFKFFFNLFFQNYRTKYFNGHSLIAIFSRFSGFKKTWTTKLFLILQKIDLFFKFYTINFEHHVLSILTKNIFKMNSNEKCVRFQTGNLKTILKTFSFMFKMREFLRDLCIGVRPWISSIFPKFPNFRSVQKMEKNSHFMKWLQSF